MNEQLFVIRGMKAISKALGWSPSTLYRKIESGYPLTIYYDEAGNAFTTPEAIRSALAQEISDAGQHGPRQVGRLR